jgi:pre-mRNA 3'-end-processing factor FIP1
MPEDQLNALPIEVRQMVMTGTTAMMAGAGTNPAMMAGGVGMNPMMDMSGMNAMNMGAMGMGMNGDMGMQMQPGGPMMQDAPGQGQSVVAAGTPEQGVQMAIPDGFGPGVPAAGMMGMGMAGDFGMQVRVQDLVVLEFGCKALASFFCRRIRAPWGK